MICFLKHWHVSCACKVIILMGHPLYRAFHYVNPNRDKTLIFAKRRHFDQNRAESGMLFSNVQGKCQVIPLCDLCKRKINTCGPFSNVLLIDGILLDTVYAFRFLLLWVLCIHAGIMSKLNQSASPSPTCLPPSIILRLS